MAQFIGFGNNANGNLTISSPTTDTVIDSAATATSGSHEITATNISFDSGQIILIWGDGNWEVNKIESYAAGTITTVLPIANDYASGSQVLVVKQYGNVTINDTLTAKDWNGTVGGILSFMVSGKLYISENGVISADGCGYRGGDGTGPGVAGTIGNCGEGNTGSKNVKVVDTGGSGGGAGQIGSDTGGGGGGNGEDGIDGTVGVGGTGGKGGTTSGESNLTVAFFGGGGGSGQSDDSTSGKGGDGGGIVIIFCNEFVNDGTVTSNGEDGVLSGQAGSGGGAGGSNLVVCMVFINRGTIRALGGSGSVALGGDGGKGGVGRNRVNSCSISGDSNPAMSKQEGGHPWCGNIAQII